MPTSDTRWFMEGCTRDMGRPLYVLSALERRELSEGMECTPGPGDQLDDVRDPRTFDFDLLSMRCREAERQILTDSCGSNGNERFGVKISGTVVS